MLQRYFFDLSRKDKQLYIIVIQELTVEAVS
jgi:hypothetical protein